MKQKTYENYPCSTVLAVNVFTFLTYISGAYIMLQFGILWLAAYLLYIIWMEFRLMNHCAGCYYYGKCCANGRGKISSLFFRKGSPKAFMRKITWKGMIPDFLVTMIPIVVGIALLVMNFNWLILGLVVLLFVLMTAGNAVVHGSLICRYCRQRELGCPAEQLFNRKKK